MCVCVIPIFGHQEVVLNDCAGNQQPEEERRKRGTLLKSGELYGTYPGYHAGILQSSVYVLADTSCCQSADPHGDSTENKAPVERGGLVRQPSSLRQLKVAHDDDVDDETRCVCEVIGVIHGGKTDCHPKVELIIIRSYRSGAVAGPTPSCRGSNNTRCIHPADLRNK